MITTTKQAIGIKLAETVGHNKFYFSLKSSGHGHTSISCKTHVRAVWSVPASERAFGVETKDVIVKG